MEKSRPVQVVRKTGPGVCAFIRIHEWRALGFWDKAKLVNSKQKEQGLTSSTEVLSKMHKASSRALGKSVHPKSL